MNAAQPITAGPRVTSSFSRPLATLGLIAMGLGLAWFMVCIGYVLVVALLDAALCPPLERQGNFGQFGFLILLIAPMLLLCGISFGLIPFMRWWVWALCFIFIFSVSYFLTGRVAEFHHNPLHVTSVALFLVGILLCVCGILARFVYRYIEFCESDIVPQKSGNGRHR